MSTHDRYHRRSDQVSANLTVRPSVPANGHDLYHLDVEADQDTILDLRFLIQEALQERGFENKSPYTP